MRRAFADTLITLATNDPKIILLTGDLGFGVFDSYQSLFPDRFINVGICEQAMVDISAGLAMEGYKPIIYSIASFMTGRAWEQIKISLSFHNLPVVVVGAGGGYLYSKAGTTHHAIEDLALMSLLPNMTVTAPGCPSEVSALLPQLVNLSGPSYMRIGRYGEPEYEGEQTIVGKARELRQGGKIALLTTGDMAEVCVRASDMMADNGSTRPTVYQFHTIKPLDTDTLDDLSKDVDIFIIIEEHIPIGGLYAAVLHWKNQMVPSIDVLGLSPDNALLVGTKERSQVVPNAEYIASSCEGLLWSQ